VAPRVCVRVHARVLVPPNLDIHIHVQPLVRLPRPLTAQLGLYTILPSPILYGVWHIQGGGRRGGHMRILRNGRATVLQ